MKPQSASETHLQNRRKYGGLCGSRQKAAAAARKEQLGPMAIQWQNTDVWQAPHRGKLVRYPIRQMTDAHLWHTINWAVRNCVQLYADHAGKTHDAEALAAYLWLRDRPLFRALVREGVSRDFTYPEDVFRYLKQYILERSESLDGYVAWADPMKTEQVEELRPFKDAPLLPPEVEYGKERRAIKLG